MEPTPEEVKIDAREYEGLIERVERRQLREEDWKWLLAVLRTFRFIQDLLTQKNIAISKLKGLLFGSKTEKDKKPPPSSKEPPDSPSGSAGGSTVSSQAASSSEAKELEPPKPDAPGHGKRSCDSWESATCFYHPHESLKPGDLCPKCGTGKVYPFKKPGLIARVVGGPPLSMEVHGLQRLRCGSCNWLFTSRPPDEVLKYPDATPEARAMAALIKYQAATPFHRFGNLLKGLARDIPLTKLYEMGRCVFDVAVGPWEAMLDWAAQTGVILFDDTKVRIQSLIKENKENPDLQRKGMFTTTIVAKDGVQKAVLYFSGRKHAGENLRELMKRRKSELPRPSQISDALSSNGIHGPHADHGGCLDHARRKFYDILDHYPTSCQYVVDELKLVYKADADSKEQGLSDQERLAWHQNYSQPPMERIKAWGEQQLLTKQIQPNSDLGGAIQYFLKHYPSLTLFLRKAGVPVSNAECERAHKPKINIRKDSYFYRTLKGALVGDVLVSMIVTCMEIGESAFDYFVAMQKNEKDVRLNPSAWLPWNFRLRLAELPL